MADDDNLDELFGAFEDADESDSGSETPLPKKARLDAAAAPSQPTSFRQVMSQPTASHHAVKVDTKETKTTVSDETREIATGTSHDKTVRSYTAHPTLPPGLVLPTVTPPDTPAKTYPFPLDPFQQQSISYIDKQESVLVAAHTSAGKTAVAEYAVATALKAGQRVVYTAPIKALSNQKFRDLQEEFSNVGLMTGDVTINPDATCLVMTTEILRSMLYRGSELLREISWVIMDEVHYLRDSERGVVWEESIILLPHKVRFVFLSATIPNASEFADWVASIHHQPCHVVYTNYRPTPLQHYVFPSGGEGLYLVVDEKGKFRQANFEKAMASLKTSNVGAAMDQALAESGNGKGRKGKKGNSKQSPNAGLYKIVKLVMDRNLNPCIIFSFSKKDCERYAMALKDEDYTDQVEKDLIAQVYHNAIDSLSTDDQQLAQVVALLPLLKRGIAIHHGGLLPILKEIVEILFTEGLIKTLFATETFAIGINAPAKTVVFTNTRKWDGKDFRWVNSGEYIQMSGRAGRRGKDDRGIVIQMVDEKMEPAICKDMLYGAANPLDSSYRISYNMLLNLMRVQDVDPEFLIKASFYQYQRERTAPGLLAQAESLEQDARNVEFEDAQEEKIVGEYYQMDEQLWLTRRKIATTVCKPEYVLKYLQKPGRFLEVRNYGWGVFLKCNKKKISAREEVYKLDILLPCVDRRFDREDKAWKEDAENAGVPWQGSVDSCRPVKPDDDPRVITIRVFTINLEHVERLSAVVIKTPQDVTPQPARRKVHVTIKEVHKRCEDGIPLLDPVEDMGITEEAFSTNLERAKTLAERLSAHGLNEKYDESKRVELVRQYESKMDMLKQGQLLRDEARSCQAMVMKEDLKKMKRVLRKLGHVDANGVIQTKGRTACEINTSDELVVVELMFAGVFNKLSVEQCMALMSCMTFDEPNKDDDPASGLKSFLSNPYFKLQEVARSVARVVISCGLDINEDEFVDKFNPGLMEAVFAWCKGAKFSQVQKLTGSFEGTTIRALRRLEELVRQVTAAAKAVGNTDLEEKFSKGSDLIKRDIVFCSSLYL